MKKDIQIKGFLTTRWSRLHASVSYISVFLHFYLSCFDPLQINLGFYVPMEIKGK